MSVFYGGPGKYIAVCNTTNFDAHYIKVFEIPKVLPDHVMEYYGITDVNQVSASWYLMNVLDSVCCVEAVYAAEVFTDVLVGAVTS